MPGQHTSRTKASASKNPDHFYGEPGNGGPPVAVHSVCRIRLLRGPPVRGLPPIRGLPPRRVGGRNPKPQKSRVWVGLGWVSLS